MTEDLEKKLETPIPRVNIDVNLIRAESMIKYYQIGLTYMTDEIERLNKTAKPKGSTRKEYETFINEAKTKRDYHQETLKILVDAYTQRKPNYKGGRHNYTGDEYIGKG